MLAVISLAGCVGVSSFGGHNVEARIHHALPAAGVRYVNVENVSGSIVIDGWNHSGVDVSALEYGSDQGALDRTHVSIGQNGSTVFVKTTYDSGGGFFFGHNGAQVDYTIHVPATASISVSNVSGPTTLKGLDGNLDVSEISGALDASLGRVAGTRNIHMSAISGHMTVRIARNSDARVDASTISGDVNLFFPSDTHQGSVGNAATGQLGKGAASMTLKTISGAIDVLPK
ncbi:MAG TPA: DUF4097 family beta strand repeat-containing protein [Candidatus Rubrimentiphilum sp.]|nr:DUF4097 family beta strand repeat-containing protein [Candidatus Rubrimentiphilum sp.]